MKISGWGKYPCIDAVTRAPRSLPELIDCLQHRHAIARGNGRAYGDSAISATNTIEMKHFDRIHAFDPSTGQLIAEAGVLLADVLTAFGPKGWFPRVTPGTKFVTLGGMVASDVHGKNHHKEGSFSRCIDWLEVITGTGELVRCSRTENSALFNWTVGGMGLTGIILKLPLGLGQLNPPGLSKRPSSLKILSKRSRPSRGQWMQPTLLPGSIVLRRAKI